MEAAAAAVPGQVAGNTLHQQVAEGSGRHQVSERLLAECTDFVRSVN